MAAYGTTNIVRIPTRIIVSPLKDESPLLLLRIMTTPTNVNPKKAATPKAIPIKKRIP